MFRGKLNKFLPREDKKILMALFALFPIAHSGALFGQLSSRLRSFSLSSFLQTGRDINSIKAPDYELEDKNRSLINSSVNEVKTGNWNTELIGTGIGGISGNNSLEITSSDLMDDIKLEKIDGDVYPEIIKKTKALQIKSNAELEYLQNTKDLKEYVSYFQAGKLKVEKYNLAQKDNPTRSFFVDNKDLQLTTQERQAIEKFYESFYKLAKERNKNFLELERITKETWSNKNTYIPGKELNQVLSSLKRINWQAQEVKLEGDNLEGAKASLNNLYGWGSWESSPWPNLLSEKEWKEKMEELDFAKGVLKSHLRKQMWWFEDTDSEQFKNKLLYEERVKDKEGDVSLAVALNLLKEMKVIL